MRSRSRFLSQEYPTNKDRRIIDLNNGTRRAASNLNHPNILTIHEVGNDEGRHYIATEYIDGLTLRESSSLQLQTTEVLDIALQIAECS